MPRPTDTTVPDLEGRRALITGASDGIGFHIAQRLARAGAEVVMPVRNEAKGQAAAQRISRSVLGARLDVRLLDLSSLTSVTDFAAELVGEGRDLHLLINNAGVMAPPTRQVTADGFELQFATNHIGHFALTGRLWPLLVAGRGRVTTQVSMAADQHAVHWDDLQWERIYHARKAYSSSKIAMGLFAMELHRRSTANGWGVASNLSHPGISPTNLMAAQPGMGRPNDTNSIKVIRWLSRRGVLAGTAESAALAAVYAATSPEAEGGRFYGPQGSST